MHKKEHFLQINLSMLKNKFWFNHVRKKIEKIIKNCLSYILAERKWGI